MMKAGVTNIMNGLEEGRIDQKGLAQVLVGSGIAVLSGRSMGYNFKSLSSTGDNLARSSRISEAASETMASGKGSKGSTNAAEPPSVYGKGHNIETNGFGPDTVINRNANYGAKVADPSYGTATKPIGDYQLGTSNPSQGYVTGTSRMGMAAGAEERIWLKAGDSTGMLGVPGRKVSGSLGSTGIDVGKPKVPDVPEIGGRKAERLSEIYNSIKEAPNYPEGFQMRTNGTTTNNIKNHQLLEKLKEIERGTWKKVYKDGYDALGNRISIHYFQSQSGRVFDVKVKKGWSN